MDALETQTASPTAKEISKQRTFTCLCCRIRFDSIDLQRAHFKTEWHLYNLKRRVCHLEPLDLESFCKIEATAPAKRDSQVSCNKNLPPSQSKTVLANDDNDDDDANWEEVDDEELLDEDYNEEEAAEMLSRVVKSNCCLFCDKKSKNIKDNVIHMNLMHGFFIPEEQYLLDLDGLMEYLGFKVGAGATCLWCNKQFTTLHGVRLHMMYKDHCKILYDQEKAVEEFKDFYDYSTQEHIKMKPLDQLAIPKKRSERRAEYDRTLAKAKSSTGDNSKQLVAQGNLAMVPSSYQAKNIKKFNAYRAKIVLRTGMANNYTMRGRLRQQNPI